MFLTLNLKPLETGTEYTWFHWFRSKVYGSLRVKWVQAYKKYCIKIIYFLKYLSSFLGFVRSIFLTLIWLLCRIRLSQMHYRSFHAWLLHFSSTEQLINLMPRQGSTGSSSRRAYRVSTTTAQDFGARGAFMGAGDADYHSLIGSSHGRTLSSYLPG